MRVRAEPTGESFPAAEGQTAVVELRPGPDGTELPPVPVPVSVRGMCPSYLARIRTWLRPLVEPNPDVESAVEDELDAMMPMFGSPERTLSGFAWLCEAASRTAGWSAWPEAKTGEFEAAIHVPGGGHEVRWVDALGDGGEGGVEEARVDAAEPGDEGLLDLLARSDLRLGAGGGGPVTMDGLKSTASGVLSRSSEDGAGDPGGEGPGGASAELDAAETYLLTLGLRLAYHEVIQVYGVWLSSEPVEEWLAGASAESRRLTSLLYQPEAAWPDRPLVAAVTRDGATELRPLPPFGDAGRTFGSERVTGLLRSLLAGEEVDGETLARWRSFLAARAGTSRAGSADGAGGPLVRDGASALRSELAEVVADSAELGRAEIEAVTGRSWEALAFEEIGERWDQPEGRVRRAYLSARRDLRACEPLLELVR